MAEPVAIVTDNNAAANIETLHYIVYYLYE